MYRYNHAGMIVRESDNATFEPNPSNRDYAALIASGAEIAPYEPPAPPVPQAVTPWQAREALRRAGILPQVNAHIDALGENDQVYIAWHYAERIARQSPLIAAIAPLFGLNDKALDALFVAASKLSLES